MKLTLHQKKVLGALYALEMTHDWPWWTGHALGKVVSGPYQPVRSVTLARLAGEGLVQTQASTWSAEMVHQVRCGCQAHHYGLTDKGREFVQQMSFRLGDDFRDRVDSCSTYAINFTQRLLDRQGANLDEDDD